jgi:hypothetical protein
MTTNYQNGKIYKIECPSGDEGDIYIGSTCKEDLSQRMIHHRCDFKRWKEGKRRNISSFQLFDKYGIDNCVIILIESFPCNCIDELYAKEAFHIKSMKCVNKLIPGQNTEKKKTFLCECGKILCYNQKARHLKTKQHNKLCQKVKKS